jgi:hypothetical protein
MLLTSSPSFARMFNASRNALDLGKALDDGKIVLVSTETNFLHDFSPLFGRYFISQTMSAARKRAAIPEHERSPAFIVVDEAGDYFDERTETMLRTLRSYRVGSVLAFQDFGRLDPGLQSAVSSSTSIRLAGGKIDDLKYAAHLAHVEPEFVASMRKVDRSYSEFACYVDRLTPKGVALRVPHGTVDKQNQMTQEDYDFMRQKNRASLTGLSVPESPATKHKDINEATEPELPSSPPVPVPVEALRRREAPIIKVGDRDDHTSLGKW